MSWSGVDPCSADDPSRHPEQWQRVSGQRCPRLVEHSADLAPRFGHLAVGEGDLAGDPAHAEPRLGLDLHDLGHRRAHGAEGFGRAGRLAEPEDGPDARTLQVNGEGCRRVESEGALDERSGTIPLAEREQGVDRVGREDDARATLDALGAGLLEALFGKTHRFVVVADQVMQVGRVDPVAQHGRAVAL